ncbi:MAG: hypothetical protein H0U04_20270 [Rubrobacter sp.]|nr:hypothetical protein [Rubrobacter sp.]
MSLRLHSYLADVHVRMYDEVMRIVGVGVHVRRIDAFDFKAYSLPLQTDAAYSSLTAEA